MTDLVLPFAEIRRDDLAIVGGKGANLGELTAAGANVPSGFCVTTAAFEQFLSAVPDAAAWLAEVDALDLDDVEAVRVRGARIRAGLEQVAIPESIEAAVRAMFAALDDDHAWAVRSSATLEDLPEASFAGQQDTYLNVRGAASLLDAVRRCWASLFTDRAILYRRRHGYDSRRARLSVVVQRMVSSDVSGILFTADPITGHRKICSIDASYGLGEAIVSGIVDADNFRVDRRDGTEVSRRIGAKRVEIVGLPDGGTHERAVDAARSGRASLSDAQIAELAALAGAIEGHYGTPQDIEWAFQDGELFVLQSRPITTLFPIPRPAPSDDGLHVYISFGHVQVMTEPMRPLGMDVIRLAIPIGKKNFEPRALNPYLVEAGHRLWVDLTLPLKSRLRDRIPSFLDFVDETMSGIVMSIAARDEFRQSSAPSARLGRFALRFAIPMLLRTFLNLCWRDQERVTARASVVLDDLVSDSRRRLSEAAQKVEVARTVVGRCLLMLFPHFMPVVLAGVISQRLLERRFGKVRVDPLTRGLVGNVTTDMDLELADVADAARPVPELVEFLRSDPAAHEFDGGREIDGAADFYAAWDAFLQRYGHRGPGEIDITRPRWADDPRSLSKTLVGMLSDPDVGAHRDKHRALGEAGEATASSLVADAGFGRRWWVRRLTRNVRLYMALREHPKFTLMRVFGMVREVFLQRGQQLGIGEDVWMLHIDELQNFDEATMAPLPREREAQRRRYFDLRPPRVITSDGESPPPPQRADLPEGALAGISASTGAVEGRARVVLDPTGEVLHAGEILVAPFSDPGWTPLFIHASGLVMEVGGLMTHGSVVAREYGIPAVVGVDDATRKIETGQWIRVDGDAGIVEVLEDA